MSEDAARLLALVELWHGACTDFVALARSLPEEDWERPTDLAGWSVKDNVAHTAHLEAVLAGTPEETLHVDEAPHLTSLMSYYTEQGVLARRHRTMEELAEELETAVQKRYAALRADPPTDPQASPPKTPGDVGWNNLTLLSNRPLDVWMHEQDVRRATNRPGGYDSPAAGHVIGVFARSLPMVLGKRVAASPGSAVRLVVGERSWTAVIGEDGRGVHDDAAEVTATVTLEPEAYVVLAGGRRTPDRVDARIDGDEALGRSVLASLAVTP